jgi:hypothetical protein
MSGPASGHAAAGRIPIAQRRPRIKPARGARGEAESTLGVLDRLLREETLRQRLRGRERRLRARV